MNANALWNQHQTKQMCLTIPVNAKSDSTTAPTMIVDDFESGVIPFWKQHWMAIHQRKHIILLTTSHLRFSLCHLWKYCATKSATYIPRQLQRSKTDVESVDTVNKHWTKQWMCITTAIIHAIMEDPDWWIIWDKSSGWVSTKMESRKNESQHLLIVVLWRLIMS